MFTYCKHCYLVINILFEKNIMLWTNDIDKLIGQVIMNTIKLVIITHQQMTKQYRHN